MAHSIVKTSVSHSLYHSVQIVCDAQFCLALRTSAASLDQNHEMKEDT